MIDWTGAGAPAPLGPTPDGRGVNFAVHAPDATAVRVCLFDASGAETAFALPARTGPVWHGHLGGIGPGQAYGLRAEGPCRPEAGLRFAPAKLLVDPYARSITGRYRALPATFGFRGGDDPARAAAPDSRDSAPFVPRSVVDEPGRPGDVAGRPRRPWSETVIYEAHAKGLTQLHPEIPAELRGTYEALGHPALVAYLRDLGVTALELLPIHAIGDEPHLQGRGLVNYWGYSTLSYFAPETGYLGPGGAEGLREAVRRLHAAGIEVILDVVYNHTAECGTLDGPTLSFRGLDPLSYKLRPDDLSRDWDVTGCGNTLDGSREAVADLVVASLRHWATSYGVDGFRFDLAPALGREPHDFDKAAPLLRRIETEPDLAGLKLIAEAWDVGAGGYQVGGFGAAWSEWNDRFRDASRAFWRGDPASLPAYTQGLTGSKEIYRASGRLPQASVNFVTAHDGFTLRDLVSYGRKHNGANGENNRDGNDRNLSDNHGCEGDTDDPAIGAARARTVRNHLATLALARGVPMLVAGDELSRSQGGNNNAYCLDGPVSWLDWTAGRAHDPDLPAFVRHAFAVRRDVPALRRNAFLTGEVASATGRRDAVWLTPDGREMDGREWGDPAHRHFALLLDDPGGAALLVLNGTPEPVSYRLPGDPAGKAWRPVLDTGEPTGVPAAITAASVAGTFVCPPRSTVLFTTEN